MILVLLGTQNNNFERLLKEIDRCIENKVIKEEVIVQSGFTKYESKNMQIFDMISKEEIAKKVEQANIIITHGGVGSIQMSLEAGKKVIAVPRKSEFGEHVNDHQCQIVESFEKSGYLIAVEDLNKLADAIIEIQNKEFKRYVKQKSEIIKTIEEFIEKDGKNMKEVREFDNIREIIQKSAEAYGNKIAFTIKEKIEKNPVYINKTYKDLLEDVNKFGTSLYEMNFKGKRIAIIGKNRYEWVISHIANLCGSIVSIPLDKDLQYDELENSLIRSKADALIFDEKQLEKVALLKESKKTNIKEFISMGKLEGFKDVQELIEQGEKLLEEGKKEYIENKIDENEMAILLFTSGTTSKSKAVMLSQKNIASNIYAMQCAEDIRDTDTNIAFLPFHHIFGSTCIIMMLACGVKTVFPDGLRYIKQNLNEYKVTVFVGVPVLVEAIYKTIMKEIEKQKKTKLIENLMKLSNALLKCHIDIRRKLFKQVINALGGELRSVISGGAPADAKIMDGFNSLGINVFQGYGLSETSPVIAAEDPKHRRSGTVGTPMKNDTIEIVNKDSDGIGEIRVKGPNVMLGYYEMPELTNEVLKDGWFYTGDLGYIDKDGYVWITGRNKNMIVLKNGKKVFPEELEMIINRMDLVSECMVFGMPEKGDEKDLKLSVKVVYDKDVVKEKYGKIEEKELKDIIWSKIKEINQSFPRYKHIQNMILTDEELIKTTTKKIKRFEEMKKIL